MKAVRTFNYFKVHLNLWTSTKMRSGNCERQLLVVNVCKLVQILINSCCKNVMATVFAQEYQYAQYNQGSVAKTFFISAFLTHVVQTALH